MSGKHSERSGSYHGEESEAEAMTIALIDAPTIPPGRHRRQVRTPPSVLEAIWLFVSNRERPPDRELAACVGIDDSTVRRIGRVYAAELPPPPEPEPEPVPPHICPECGAIRDGRCPICALARFAPDRKTWVRWGLGAWGEAWRG